MHTPMSHRLRTVAHMASEFESSRYVTAVESLPRPGAVQLYYFEWVPTLDGEPIDDDRYLRFRTREEALAESIRRVKHLARLTIALTIGGRAGCCEDGDIPVFAETITEARKAIVSYAKGSLSGYTRDPEQEEHLRFKTRRGRPAWKSLLECETSRHYDPDDPESGMSCSYLLYETGPLGIVGGGAWIYSVEIWATGPPAIWDHPTNQPIGLDNDDNRGDDSGRN